MTRRLIVNADDLGQSSATNRGIAAAAAAGFVTSASLMVRWPAALEAAAWARAHPDVSVGLHVDLCEWTVVDDEWRPSYTVVDVDDEAAVAAELDRQLGRFVGLLGRLPSHLDSHQHLHRGSVLGPMLRTLGERLAVDVRGVTPEVGYCGAFYGQYGAGRPYPEGITLEALLAILDGLPHGTTELACHPAAGDLADLDSLYRAERLTECAVLCDPALPGEVQLRGIELVAHTSRRNPR